MDFLNSVSVTVILAWCILEHQTHFVSTFVITPSYKADETKTIQRRLGNPEEIGPYFQGDIILPLPTDSFSGRVDLKYRWDNRTIHYEIDENYPSQLRSTFLRATDHISKRTCIQFLPRNISSSQSKDYIYVTGNVSSSCYSYVGRQGGKQIISLPLSCNGLGTFVHELLHAIGFHHEQSRTDRDDHVNIIWTNVQPGKDKQFIKYDKTMVSSFGVPYDFGSVMHYSKYAFSVSSKLETIVPKVENVEIGQRREMSEKDAEKVNRMYGC